MEGYLYKRSKVDNTVKQRKFVLSEKDKILKYYVNDVSTLQSSQWPLFYLNSMLNFAFAEERTES